MYLYNPLYSHAPTGCGTSARPRAMFLSRCTPTGVRHCRSSEVGRQPPRTLEGLAGSGMDKIVVHQLASPSQCDWRSWVPSSAGSTLSNVGFCIAHEASTIGTAHRGDIGWHASQSCAVQTGWIGKVSSGANHGSTGGSHQKPSRSLANGLMEKFSPKSCPTDQAHLRCTKRMLSCSTGIPQVQSSLRRQTCSAPLLRLP